MQSPNEEQKKAIENTGNVILQAGAGSGKTFVIINHVIFKIKKFIEECVNKKNAANFNLEKKMRVFLSKIVVMTFTTKATTEIRERVKVALDTQIEEWGNKLDNPWDMASKNLNYLSITTIHGFFFKVISKSYFNLVPSSMKILSEMSLKSKIEKLFNDWAINYKDSNKKILNSMILNSESVLDAFYFIFNSAELRLLWEKSSEEISPVEDFRICFDQILEINELKCLFLGSFDLNSYSDFSTKKWFDYLSAFEKLRSIGIPENKDMLDEYLKFFDQYKGIRAPLKKLDLFPINERMEKL